SRGTWPQQVFRSLACPATSLASFSSSSLPFLALRWLLPSLYGQRFLMVPKLVLQLTFCIRFHRSVWTKLSNACQTNENCGFAPFQQLHRPNPFLIPQVVSPLRQRLVTSALGSKVTLLSIQDLTDVWFHPHSSLQRWRRNHNARERLGGIARNEPVRMGLRQLPTSKTSSTFEKAY